MNFLAHFFLCKGKEHLIVGNFLADVLRGNQINELPVEVKNGIEMHRRIDEFTDQHKIVKELTTALKPRYARYSSIVVDILFDYILANQWSTYTDENLERFSRSIYQVLKNHSHLFNERANKLYHYMSAGDWLSNYKTSEGINMALHGMSRRASFENNMHKGFKEIEQNNALFNVSFAKFFPDLVNFVHESGYT